MADSARPSGFVPPPYPYDRLDRFVPYAEALDGGVVDLSIGTPCDPPLDSVVAALSSSNAERGYPPSIGSDALRQQAADRVRRFVDHLDRRVGVLVLARHLGRREVEARTGARKARLSGAECELTDYQFSLLLVLAQHPGRVMSRDAIMELMKNERLESFDRSIDVHI